MKRFNHINNLDNNYIFLTGWGFQATIFSTCPIAQHCSVQYAEYPDCIEHSEKIFSGDYWALFDWIVHTINAQFSGENFTLIGWSLGGLFAIYLAYLFPEKYKKIILISSLPQFVGTGITPLQAEQFTAFAKRDMPGLMRYFLRLVQYPNATLKIRQYLYQYQDQAYPRLKIYLALLLNINLILIYKKLIIPVVCLFGEQDAVIAVSDLQITHPPSAMIHKIPNAGHTLFLTHPDSLRQCIL